MAEQVEKSDRLKQIEARRERMKAFVPEREKTVRVSPANEDIRKLIKHPSGMAFPASGSAEWPLDQFTKRRLREGSVTREDEGKKGKAPSAPASPKPAA